MECPKCKHRIPDKADKCLYCGSWTKGEVLSRTETEPSQFATSAEERGKGFLRTHVTKKEEINYKKLEELPEPLRAKVEEMLKKGETQSVETKKYSYRLPESMDRTSPKKKKMGFLSALKILLKKD